MEDFIKSQLLAVGLKPEHLAVFEENEIGTQEFYSLTMEDLRVLFPNKVGIALKVIRVVQSYYTYETQYQDINNAEWKGQYFTIPPTHNPMLISTMQPPIGLHRYSSGDQTSLPDSGPSSEPIPLEDYNELMTSSVSSAIIEQEVEIPGEFKPDMILAKLAEPVPLAKDSKTNACKNHESEIHVPETQKSEIRELPEIKSNMKTDAEINLESKTVLKSTETSLEYTPRQQRPGKIQESKSDEKSSDQKYRPPDPPKSWSDEMEENSMTDEETEPVTNKTDIIPDLFSKVTLPETQKSKTIFLEQEPPVTQIVTLQKTNNRSIDSALNAALNDLTKPKFVTISISRKDSKFDYVTIKGSQIHVRTAAHEIHRIFNEQIAQTKNFVTRSLEIEKSLHKYIIGHKRRHIRQILERTGVSVYVPGQNSDCLTIDLLGPPEKIDEAMAMINEKCNPFTYAEEIFKLRGENRKCLLRKSENGQTRLDEIQRNTGAQIEIPQGQGDNATADRDLILRGPIDAIRQAKKQILALLSQKRSERNAELRMEIDPKYHKCFLQKRAKLFHEIEIENGNIRIEIPKNGSGDTRTTQCVLRGPIQYLKSAQERILKEMKRIDKEIQEKGKQSLPGPKDLNNNTGVHNRTDEKSYLEIKPSVYSRIIGFKGANISAMQKEYAVHIQFPKSTDTHPNLVVITGRNPEKISQVKVHLRDLEKKYLGEKDPTLKPRPNLIGELSDE